MESKSWNLAKSPEEENTENVVINNHQAKWFCKKKQVIFYSVLTINIHSRITLPWELHFPFFPEIRMREWEKKRERRGEKKKKDSLTEKRTYIL